MKALCAALVFAIGVARPAAGQDVDPKVILVAAGVAATAWAAHEADQAGHKHLAWPARHRVAADFLSYGTVAGGVVLACAGDFTRRCVGRSALNIGSTVAIAEITKHFIHRERPDKSDRKSFFSEHTAIACAAGFTSKRAVIASVLCGGTAYLRVAADRHFVTDVLVGAVAGFAVTRIAR